MSSETFRLFKNRLGFISGIGNSFCLSDFSKDFNYSKNEESADIEALGSDWKQIGLDMKQAISEYERTVTDIK